jgi:predicted metalloprotease with PDZ domain
MFFEVTPLNGRIIVKGKGKQGIIVFPTWVPGSYVIRDQSKYVVPLKGLSQIFKNRFFLTDEEFEYIFSAISKDQREAISIPDYLFINPASVFPYQTISEEYCVKLNIPSNWVVHTTLKDKGNNTYCGEDYDSFADSPIQASPHLKLIEIDENHKISAYGDLDEVEKIRKAIQYIDFNMGEKPKNYIFFFRRSDVNFGGIEHENSSAIVVPWDRKELTSLFAHEYFHSWNVKRIRPLEFDRVDYEKENYTDLLWVAEGLTDYVAFLATLNSSPSEAMKMLANALSSLTFPGIKYMSLAESSRFTWIKLYKRDSNFLNYAISYYDVGLVLGFIIDLTIRERSECRNSIFDFFKRLKRRYTYEDVRKTLAELGVGFLDELVYKRNPPIMDYVRKYAEVTLEDKGKPYIGIMVNNGKVTYVEEGSPADEAGILPDDEIIAVNGVKREIEVKDEPIKLTLSFERRVREVLVKPRPSPGHTVRVKLAGELMKCLSNIESIEGISDKKVL